MKKSVISISLIVVVALSVAAIAKLSLSVVVLVMVGTIFAAAFFGGLAALVVFGAKKRAELREKNPELAKELDELELVNEQMWNPYH